MLRLKTFNKLINYFKGDLGKVHQWFRTPNKHLNGIKPSALSDMEKHAELDKFIDDLINENHE